MSSFLHLSPRHRRDACPASAGMLECLTAEHNAFAVRLLRQAQFHVVRSCLCQCQSTRVEDLPCSSHAWPCQKCSLGIRRQASVYAMMQTSDYKIIRL